jgi:hypothetical protein
MLLRASILSAVGGHEGDVRRALIASHFLQEQTAFAQKVNISAVEKLFCGEGRPSQRKAVTNVIDRELPVQ